MMHYKHKMAKPQGHRTDGGDYLAGTVLGNERDITKPKGRHPRKKYGRTVMTG